MDENKLIDQLKHRIICNKINIIEELNKINTTKKKFYRSQKISNKILKNIFGIKTIKYIAKFLSKISDKLKSIE